MSGKLLEQEPVLDEYRSMFAEIGFVTAPNWPISRVHCKVELFKLDPGAFIDPIRDRIDRLTPRTKELMDHLIALGDAQD